VVAAMKFSFGRPVIRAIFAAMAFSPLYALSVYDLFSAGPTAMVVVRLVLVAIANAIVTFVISRSEFPQPPVDLRRCLLFLTPLVLPVIFIAINIQMFSGPFPIIIFSSEHSQALSLYRQVFGIADNRDADLQSVILSLPRIDVLFDSLALGACLLFFKIV